MSAFYVAITFLLIGFALGGLFVDRVRTFLGAQPEPSKPVTQPSKLDLWDND